MSSKKERKVGTEAESCCGYYNHDYSRREGLDFTKNGRNLPPLPNKPVG